MLLFTLPLMAQPKIYKEKHRKSGYTEYKISMELGGGIKSSKEISTLELKFYYKRYFTGYGDKGQMFFIHNGYDNCTEEDFNGKKTISLGLVIDNYDTLSFLPTYWGASYWTTNGVMAERPDRYYISTFYDIFDGDIQKLLNAKSIRVIKFGIYENTSWYFTNKNISDIRYLIDYAKAQEADGKKKK